MNQQLSSEAQFNSKNLGLNISGLSLLTIAATGFMLVPRQKFIGMTGTWFTIGFPFETATLKVGYVTPEHFGLHPCSSPFCLLNAAFWIGLIMGYRRIARFDHWPIFAFQIVRWVAALATYVSAGWLSYGVFNIIDALTSH